MKWGQLLLCGWPGLAHLWLRGSFIALAGAIGFSILLNLALVSTFLWPALMGEMFLVVVWPVIFLVWTASTMTSLRVIEPLAAPPKMSAERERADFSDEKNGKTEQATRSKNNSDSSHTLFNRAQREYLKGHWDEVESLLKRRLNHSERDIEARLLMATMYRHTNRAELAWEELKHIEKYDESIHWDFEIQRERQLLARADREQDDELSASRAEVE